MQVRLHMGLGTLLIQAILVMQLYSQETSLKILLDKPRHLMGDAVFIEVEWTNRHSHTPVMEFNDISLSTGALRLVIVGADSDTLGYKERTLPGAARVGVPVGQSIRKSYEVTGFYGVADTTRLFRFFRPGRYAVQAVYSPSPLLAPELSNRIEFVIEEPPVEELSALKLIFEAKQQFWNFSNSQKECVERLQALMELYPTSTYQGLAHAMLIRIATIQRDPSVAVQLIDRARLASYADDLSIWEAVKFYGLYLPRSERIAFYSRLKNSSTGEKLKKRAEEALRVLAPE